MFHVKHDCVAAYIRVVERWDRKISLLSRKYAGRVSDDLLRDSAILAGYLRAKDRHLDIGTGNGLPIIPALCQSAERPAKTVLIEADARKAAFLRAASRETGVRYEVLCNRIEKTPYVGADSISAKAFAPLPRLLHLAVPHLNPDGRILAFKGRTVEQEIAAARATWEFKLDIRDRDAETGAVLLVIRHPRRRASA